MILNRQSRLPPELSARLRLAGILVAAGIIIELTTLFWNHTVSFLLFLSLGALLVGAGMLLYLWSVLARSE